MSRIYRYGVWEPVADMGEHVRLLPSSDRQFYRVEYVEPIPFIESGTTRPGIRLRDFNADNLADGASVDATPSELHMPTLELLQMRWTIFETSIGSGLISAEASIDINEIDIRVSQLMAQSRWTTLNSRGLVNAAHLLPLVSAEEAAWSLSASIAASTGVNRIQPLPWPFLNLTELFVFEDDGPTFTVVNRAGAAITQGGLHLAVSGFRYVLSKIGPDLEREGKAFTRIPVTGHGRGGSS